MAQQNVADVDELTTVPDEWGEPIASQQLNDELWVSYSPGDASEAEIVVVKYERWDGMWEKVDIDKTTLSQLHQMLYNRHN